MKLEIYQIGKTPPLTVVECSEWKMDYSYNNPRLKCIDSSGIVAMFFLDNIAGFKEIKE